MKGYPMYLIAEEVGVHPSTLCVWFRTYNAERYEKITKAIMKLDGGNQDEQNNQG